MQTVTVRSRYGDVYKLQQIDDCTYEFIGDLEYARMGADEEGNIEFFDPSGGPFIQVQLCKIDGKIVKRIYFTDKGTVRFEVQ